MCHASTRTVWTSPRWMTRTIRLAGESSFDIRDFGMQAPKVLLLKVEPEVEVRVEIYAVKDE